MLKIKDLLFLFQSFNKIVKYIKYHVCTLSEEFNQVVTLNHCNITEYHLYCLQAPSDAQ